MLGGIGDVVIALPVVHALARRYPDAQLTLCTFAEGAPLVADDPAVTETVVLAQGEAAASTWA